MTLLEQKTGYVCGPLTELPHRQREGAKRFYEQIADVFQKVTGQRAFVPHEHYDPIKHASFTPRQVDASERKQVCKYTWCLVAVPLAGSWGSGIEVEMAYRSEVPIILLCGRKKLEHKKISRLLRGNPAVLAEISYVSRKEALDMLEKELREIF